MFLHTGQKPQKSYNKDNLHAYMYIKQTLLIASRNADAM